MSKQTDKQDELSAAVDASEARSKPHPDAGEPEGRPTSEKLTDLVREHPGMAVAAGLGLGILASVLIPKSPVRKAARGGGMLAAAAAELAVLVAQQVMTKAGEAGDYGRERAGDLGNQVGDAAHRAATAGRAAGRTVQRFAGETSAAAREAGGDLVAKAGKALARLRD